MIDSIGSATSSAAVSRTQTALQTSSLRNPDILTAVQQTQQRSSGATAPVKVFAVPQASKKGAGSGAKLPRGSLVDVLV
ncbi:MAG: hypothetical protein P4M13_04870 [Alphaproteobacteria bacterium]|nr:hypothetical protein [Alphaproteobacteria bacterium]